MAKKRTSHQSRSHGFGIKSLLPELQKAEALMVREEWQEARQVLERLSQDYPTNPDVLSHLVNVCLELHDLPAYTNACQRLIAVDPKNADAAYALAGGYLSCMHPFLALDAFHHALDRFPNHEKAKEARTFVADLETKMDEELEKMGLAGEQGRTIARLHEQGQADLESGRYQQAREAEEAVLRLKPDFVSASNNLCLIHFVEGDLDGAIALAHKVLDQHPDNIHALSNLVRFHLMKGDREQAQQFGEQLKASQAEGWDRWTKKAEGLSYLGDDAGVLAVFEKAKAASDLEITGAMFHHFVAVALERTGQHKQARQEWQQALTRSPGFALAQANLNDLRQPVGQRHAPWSFNLNSWLHRSEVDALLADINLIAGKPNAKSSNDAKVTQATRQHLRKHPHLLHLIPILLDRGDPAGREFAFRLAAIASTPETLKALQDFTFSQAGPDQLRHQAAIKLSEAGLITDEMARLWLQGQWREVSLIAYEFHSDPPYKHSRKVQNWLKEAISSLKENTPQAAERAEQALQQALAVEPDAPDLHNNLAIAYQIQGRTADASALLHQIMEQHPDYVPARASVARLHLEAGDLEVAESLLKPLLSRKRFHFNDFGAFSSAYIQLLIAKKQPDGARSWLQMWEQVDPEHPEFQHWQTRLAGPKIMKPFSRFWQHGQ